MDSEKEFAYATACKENALFSSQSSDLVGVILVVVLLLVSIVLVLA
ncbi:MAG: hypothetical protein ABIH99_05935 [Candidatus Micrarchaeota archaeon]